jgi:hypothetical protein
LLQCAPAWRRRRRFKRAARNSDSSKHAPALIEVAAVQAVPASRTETDRPRRPTPQRDLLAARQRSDLDLGSTESRHLLGFDNPQAF